MGRYDISYEPHESLGTVLLTEALIRKVRLPSYIQVLDESLCMHALYPPMHIQVLDEKWDQQHLPGCGEQCHRGRLLTLP